MSLTYYLDRNRIRICCYHLAGHVSCHFADFLQLSGRGLSRLLTSPCFCASPSPLFLLSVISHNDWLVKNAIIFDCSLRCHVCIARQMPHIYHTSCAANKKEDIFASRHGESDMEFIVPVWGHISGAAFVRKCQWL